jgi:hypothetical protein
MNQTTLASNFTTFPPTLNGARLLAIDTIADTLWTRNNQGQFELNENALDDLLEGKRAVILRVPCCSCNDGREEQLLDRLLGAFRITAVVSSRDNDYIYRKQLYLERN